MSQHNPEECGMGVGIGEEDSTTGPINVQQLKILIWHTLFRICFEFRI